MTDPGLGGPHEEDLTTLLNGLSRSESADGGGFDPAKVPFDDLYSIVRHVVRRVRRPRANSGTAQTTDLAHRILERTMLRPPEDGADAPSAAAPPSDPEDAPQARWNDRSHFFNYIAWLTVRTMLDDYARHRALKRGGASAHVPLDTVAVAASEEGNGTLATANMSDEQMVRLLEELERLRHIDPRAATVVTLRSVAGLTIKETAIAIGHSTKTVNRDYRAGRAWLFERVVGRPPEPGELP